jgi:hypothetical protein
MLELRPEVQAFAEQMELKLMANDHKGGWKDCNLAYLYGCLGEELAELMAAITLNRPAAIWAS